MDTHPLGPSAVGPDEWFTGAVLMDSIGAAQEPAPHSLALVHFSPGARTAWHTHSIRQTLYVTHGEGLVQARGETAHRIRGGDVVHVLGDEWHWHGATADHLMTHLSLAEGVATWGDHVTDEEYEQAHAQAHAQAHRHA